MLLGTALTAMENERFHRAVAFTSCCVSNFEGSSNVQPKTKQALAKSAVIEEGQVKEEFEHVLNRSS
jgi:hypothetical protein